VWGFPACDAPAHLPRRRGAIFLPALTGERSALKSRFPLISRADSLLLSPSGKPFRSCLVSHARTSCLCLLLTLGLLCASCYVPPRSYGLNAQGERPVPPLPRWIGQLPASSAQTQGQQAEAPTQSVPSPLTLQDAFLFALKANKDLMVSDLGTEASKAGIMGAKGQFDPTVFATVSRGYTRTPVDGIPVTTTSQAEGFAQVGVSQRAITGTDIGLTASNAYVHDHTGSLAVNPAHSPAVDLTVSQDLLKDFGISVNRTDVSVAENQYAVSQQDLRNTAISTLFEVEDAYWELYFAQQDLVVRQQQRASAQRLVEVAQAQVNAGISAPLDVVRAKSSAAAQEVSILNAQNTITQLRRRLLRVMGIIDPALADSDFKLADQPPQAPYQTTLADAVGAALEARPDYLQALLSIDTRRLQMHFFKNQELPTLQLFGEYLLTGLDDEFSGAADDVTDRNYDSWSLGLRFSFPIPNRTARSNYQVARLQHEQALWRWRSVYESVVRDVGDALSNLQTAESRITTAENARSLAEQVLSAEGKSFSLGRSDSLDVLTAQTNLASAQRDEARAHADYAIALADLYRAEGTLLKVKGVAVAGEQPQDAPKPPAKP
jgi:outer membrane protein